MAIWRMQVSGIGRYNEQQFIRIIRTGRSGNRPINSTMPWLFFRHLTDSDLAAIFGYLKGCLRYRTKSTIPSRLPLVASVAKSMDAEIKTEYVDESASLAADASADCLFCPSFTSQPEGRRLSLEHSCPWQRIPAIPGEEVIRRPNWANGLSPSSL
jgi:hypothetical protein